MRKLLVALSVFIPTFVFAVPYIFPVVSTDLSANYLLKVLGPVGDVAVSSPVGPNAASVLISAFGSCLVSASILLGGFIGFRSVFVGSGSGNILGDKVSSLHAPAKIVGGLAFLIPDNSGYAPVQHFVIWTIMNGVGFANQLWLQIVSNYQMGNTLIVNNQSHFGDSSTIEYVTQDLFYVALSKVVAQKVYSDLGTPLGSIVVDAVIDPAGYTGSQRPAQVCLFNDLVRDPTRRTCSINRLINYPVQDTNNVQTYSLTAAQLAMILDKYVSKIEEDPIITYALTNNLMTNGTMSFVAVGGTVALDAGIFFGNTACHDIVMNYEQAITDDLLNYISATGNASSDVQTMQQEGWMSAAYYYWTLNDSDTTGYDKVDSLLKGLSSNANSQDFPGSLLNSADAGYSFKEAMSYKNPIVNYVQTIFTAKNKKINSTGYQSQINAASTAGLSDLLGQSSANLLLSGLIPTTDGPTSFYALDYDFTKDRVKMFIKSNGAIINGALTFIQVMCIIAFLLAIAMTIMRGASPGFEIFCAIVFAIVGFIVPFISLLLGTAVMGSIYVASIPGIIFGLGALSWFMKALEIVIAAPIVSMAYMMPDRDDTAKIHYAMMQLLVVTLKPALMILGFAISAKLAQLNIMFVGGAFSMLGQQLASNGTTGGLIFFVMMYELTTLTTVSLIARAFGVITSLPDQVFMMMGVSAHDNDTDMLLDQFESSAQQGGSAFNQILSSLGGLMNMMQKIGKAGSDFRNPQKNK